jgi:ATP-binding protein involved in chromosome partitioning
MSTVTQEDVLAALSGVLDPSKGKDIVSTGQVKSLTVAEGKVNFILEVDAARGSAMEPLRAAAQKAAEAVDGVASVTVIMTAHAAEGTAKRAPPPIPSLKIPTAHNHDHGHSHDHSHAPTPPKPIPAKPAGPNLPAGVKKIIAIASGKGGVGKSTVASNLAVAMAAKGKRVGLLDADVYGPSQPRMLGVSGRPSSPDGTTILPLRNHGVTLMSLGLMVAEDEAIVWRGPMLMGALQQMLGQVQWGKLDVLIVDLPPGTGDVQMTLSQKVDVAGAIIVSTPQDIALLDARKGIDMFKRLNVPIYGLIENMSSFVCDGCGKVHHPFGHGGARAEAEKLGLPFLGEIPLDLEIRIASDGGAPLVVSKPDSPQAKAFFDLVDTLDAAGLFE